MRSILISFLALQGYLVSLPLTVGSDKVPSASLPLSPLSPLSASLASPRPSLSSELLQNITQFYWQWRLVEFPTMATMHGIHAYDDRLEEYSPAAWDRRKNHCQSFLKLLDSVDTSQLTLREQQTQQVLREELITFLEGYKWRWHSAVNPINMFEGIHKPPLWTLRMPFKTELHFQNYQARLRAVPKQIDEIIALMREAMKRNHTNHIVSMGAVTRQMTPMFGPPQNTAFYHPYQHKLPKSDINSTDWSQHRRQGFHIIKTIVQPAYRRLKEFLENEYLNATRTAYGVGSFTKGREFYEACLKFALSTEMTAAEVRDLGRTEVKRVEREIAKIMKRFRFKGTFRQFTSFLKKHRHKRYFNLNEKTLLDGYRHIIFTRINPRLGKIINRVPANDSLSIVPLRRRGPAGAYKDGKFFVNTVQPGSRPTYSMMSLALHETIPGHHLQLKYNDRQLLPPFRRLLWATNHYAIPFNFPWYSSFTEGWAMYAESLGDDMGVYNRSALELLGRYSNEIFRASRLVVDTGIHIFGMDRQEAVEYMYNHTMMSRKQCENEIDRSITWPGQACAFMIGATKIRSLREKAQWLLGRKFDIRTFHDVILRVGRAPLSVIETEVFKWLEEESAAIAPPETIDITVAPSNILDTTASPTESQNMEIPIRHRPKDGFQEEYDPPANRGSKHHDHGLEIENDHIPLSRGVIIHGTTTTFRVLAAVLVMLLYSIGAYN